MRTYRLLASVVVGGVWWTGCSNSSSPSSSPPPDPKPSPDKPAQDKPAADKQAPDKPGVVAAGATATRDTPSGDAAKRDAELAEKAAGIVDAFSNSEPVVTRDGKRVVFVSTRDGLPQLYVAETAKPAAAPVRLLTTTERITGPFATKDGAILYRSDKGADELWSVFRVGLDGSDPVELTPGERLQRDPILVPDGAPEKMFFSGRKMAEPRTTVYVASTAKAEPAKEIYSFEKPAYLADVSADGAWGLVRQVLNRSETFLVRVDLATGEAKPLWPPADSKFSISATKISADGKLVYAATDLGSEQTVILALDATTGKELARHAVTPATAEVGAISVAKRGGLVAAALTVGNHFELRVLDGKKLTPAAKVTLPLASSGIASALGVTPWGFTDDGARILVTWSTPSAPPDLFAIDAKTGKVAPLVKEVRASLKDLPKIDVKSLEIPAFDGGKIPMNAYVPAGEEKKPHPVLVVYHGGPASVSQIQWRIWTAFYASLGYAIVEPNVRGSTGYGRAFEAGDNGPKRLDAFKDIETSARWVAQQPWADKDRLVVFGGSYGGYTTMIALSRWPDIWRAGVNLFGVVNMKTFMASTTGVIRQLFLLEFGDPEKDAAFLTSISPLTDVGKVMDPTFVYAGANDPRVPLAESDQIVQALRQRSIPTEYMVADNEGHSLARRENQLALLARSARFLEAHLR